MRKSDTRRRLVVVECAERGLERRWMLRKIVVGVVNGALRKGQTWNRG